MAGLARCWRFLGSVLAGKVAWMREGGRMLHFMACPSGIQAGDHISATRRERQSRRQTFPGQAAR